MTATKVRHPAKFSDSILARLAHTLPPLVPPPARVLDPFAGTGRVHDLGAVGYDTIGVELEPEWATLHPQTLVGNALALPFPDNTFDAIVTSPCYGNRMADHHDAKDSSRRITYRHTLGRALHDDNAGKLQWGKAYREFHHRAWRESLRVLRVGGLMVVNVSDHIRGGHVQPVVAWHYATLVTIGCVTARSRSYVDTPRMKFGENHDQRVDSETILYMRKV